MKAGPLRQPGAARVQPCTSTPNQVPSHPPTMTWAGCPSSRPAHLSDYLWLIGGTVVTPNISRKLLCYQMIFSSYGGGGNLAIPSNCKHMHFEQAVEGWVFCCYQRKKKINIILISVRLLWILKHVANKRIPFEVTWGLFVNCITFFKLTESETIRGAFRYYRKQCPQEQAKLSSYSTTKNALQIRFASDF